MNGDLAALARSVIAVGFTGDSVADAPLDALRAFGPGAIVLFARNIGRPGDVRALVTALRRIAETPPLIAIDQEGGRVARIREGVAQLPAAMAVGATGDGDLCERLGVLLGRDLAELGISVDFAPVADVASHSGNTAIGTRAYAGDAEICGRFATAFACGLERGGVAATLKHFPGHGATDGDSHLMLPRVTADEATLRERDLVPFAAAIASGSASIVMTTHVVADAFDATQPATTSKRILTDLLRGEMAFRGVVCTDCLEMDAIRTTLGTVRGAVLALAAGADLLLVSHTLALAEEAADAIVSAVGDGTIPRTRLDEAAARVRGLRERYASLVPFAGTVDSDAPLAAARRAVTVVRGSVRLRDERPVTVLSFEGRAFDGAGGARVERASLSSALRARRWKSEVMRIPLEPDAGDLALLLSHLPALGDRNFVIVTRRAHRLPPQADAVERILAVVPDAIVIAANEPHDVALWPRARNVAAIYGDDELAFAGCADVLAGRAQGEGRLPVDVGDVSVR